MPRTRVDENMMSRKSNAMPDDQYTGQDPPRQYAQPDTIDDGWAQDTG